MMRHVTIGTAGHVDHGKTALVTALTGVDTDRWAEEKRRGITIDLGFAPLRLSDTISASVVDVPGHEDFIRNMVAGATGIDLALLVVAADEGIMPQTVEHLAILGFLGVRAGVVAVTKADLAEAEWLELVLADVAERLEESPIEWSAPVTVSTVDGQGLEELRTALTAAASLAAERSSDDLFRMPIDRTFSVAGAGTVVTGTAWSGSVAVGDSVRVLPGGGRTRVRSVEVHGEARERAEPGRRTALALPSIERGEATRGHVVVADDVWQAGTAIDVLITLLPSARPLTQRTRIRLHLGTAEVMARVTPAAGEIVPGATVAARLRLERPIVARWGDRAVLRSYSPITTIGGCVVVDPWPPRRPRRPRRLEQRSSPDVLRRVREFVNLAGKEGLATDELAVRTGIHPKAQDEVIVNVTATEEVTLVGSRLFPNSVLDAARRRTLEALAGFHEHQPLEPGMSRELLRAAIDPPEIADAVQQALEADGVIAIEGGTVRLREFRAQLAGAREEAGRALRAELVAAGFRGQTVSDRRDLAEFFVRQGTAVRVGTDRYYDAEALGRLKDEILDEVRQRSRATPAELRARTGLTRKYLIPVLEWMDAAGLTVRDGDGRSLGGRA